MVQRTSDKGLIEIIAHEAIVLSPYRDVKDIWTIGIGHTAMAGGINPAKFTGKLTLAGALLVFRTDLAKYEQRVRQAFTRPLTQYQFDAAVSFDFNTGAIDRATWVETFNAGDRDVAVSQIMNWQKPPQIIPRRKKEQLLFASGKYSANGTATVYPANNSGLVLWSQGRQVNLDGLLGAPKSAAKTEIESRPASMAQRILRRIKAMFSAVL
jgi:lysozyme